MISSLKFEQIQSLFLACKIVSSWVKDYSGSSEALSTMTALKHAAQITLFFSPTTRVFIGVH